MSIQLPAISRDLPGNFKLPEGITMESLYQIKKQSIWFLIWIFKKNRFWLDLTRVVLEEPFKVKRGYWSSGQICFIEITNNNKYYSVNRVWYKNGQLNLESYWKNGLRNGISREWYYDGKLIYKSYWKDNIILY